MSRLIAVLISAGALLLPTALFASQSVALSSEVFLEKSVLDSKGKLQTVLTAPEMVTPGDRLIFFLNFRNYGAVPATNFVITNPLPGAVAYRGTNHPAATMSVDGGKTWGPLAALNIREPDGTLRTARDEDVTHIRWIMRNAIPAGGQGKISFRGVVR